MKKVLVMYQIVSQVGGASMENDVYLLNAWPTTEEELEKIRGNIRERKAGGVAAIISFIGFQELIQ
jgi:hypothetical protein